MKKYEADRIIEEYMKPLYRFALNKTRNISEAEELASRIVLQVYNVLIKKDSFIDLNSYIFKIAHNVWTTYLDDKTNGNSSITIDEVNAISDLDVERNVMENEVSGKLRLEIAFLSKQQREIVILHYYNGLKLGEIAKRLGLSEGTVKWHIYESKKEMKKGMEIMRTVGNLGCNPIKFIYMGHDGCPGKKGDTQDFLRKAITQNIAYAAYHEPKTINEIAEELGISPVFAEDEIIELEEYGFLDKLPGGRYQTNMMIMDQSEEKWEEIHNLSKKYADILVEEYFMEFFKLEDQFKKLGVYIPNNDFNLLLWSIIPYSMRKLCFKELVKVTRDEVATIRKDGGNYIATATLEKSIKKSEDFNYNFCGDMTRGDDELAIWSWQLDTIWSDREMNWRDNLNSDYVGLYHFIKGDLKENSVNIDIYRRLIDKGYLIKNNNEYMVNIIYSENKEIEDRLNALLPEPSEKLVKLGEKFDKAIYEIERIGQPFHIHKIVKYFSQNRFLAIRTYIMKNLFDRGLLKEVNPEAAKGISTILFIEGR